MSKCFQRKCLHCNKLFQPHCRNRHHQLFCFQAACRKASKAHSQRRWLNKPENRDIFRGLANVERVRQWRKANPGYWKRPAKAPGTLQEVLPPPVPPQTPQPQALPAKTSLPPLQDVLAQLMAAQHPLIVGLIAHLIDSPLQEDIAQTLHRLVLNGLNILDSTSGINIAQLYENQKTNPVPGAAAPHSRAVQLDRPTLGP